MEIRDFLTMTADLNENYRIYIDQTPPVPAGILRVTDGAAVFLETKKPLTVKYVFGLKISNDKILLN